MFKSIFAKYVTAFMLIVTVGFAVLLLVVTSIVSNDSIQTKSTLMDNAAAVTRVYLEEKCLAATPQNFHEILKREGNEHLSKLLASFSGHESDLIVLIADTNGSVYSTVGIEADKPIDASGVVLPAAVTKTVEVGGTFSESVKIASFGKILTHAVGVYNQDGELCGVVAVCSENARLGYAVENLIKTVLTSAFLVLLAALIAAYFITERIISPLREMRNAAKKFASGQFESRVLVRGKDEISELSEAFNQMADSLENLEKMRNSFVANVSHDLRTPMTTIAGFIDGIRDGVIPKEEQEHYLDVVSIEVHRLSRLVASLLDISRIQAGDRKFTMKPFDICEMARLILISFEQKIDEKRLDIEFDCVEEHISVLADHDAIYQIFYNICHNAVKFSYVGGKLRIRISLTKERKVQISVYNEGEGIPEGDLPMVFERFYKSDKSRGLDKSGVGLGLYIAKTIITAHKEKIWVASESGKYCEFFFTLQRTQF